MKLSRLATAHQRAFGVVRSDYSSCKRGGWVLLAEPKRLAGFASDMKRPYRDVLVWLADIRPLDNNLSADRAIAAIITMLAAYDRDPRLAARWTNVTRYAVSYAIC